MKPFQLTLAPLRGLTDHIFRNIYTAHFTGFDKAVAPFISSKKDHKFKKKYIKDILLENNPGLRVTPQILGNSPADFIALGNYIFQSGHTTLNWNLGCPYPMVAKKGRGSGMLPQTDRIRAFLDKVIPGLEGSLSIKLRLGWKTNQDIFGLIDIFNQYPLKELIIHPRTGIQRYEGTVDLESFGLCIEKSKIPVGYNGDIKTAADFTSLAKQFPTVNSWMIGRGCLANLFLPQLIKQPDVKITQKELRMKQFHLALLEEYKQILDGPTHILNKMKGFWQYFSKPFACYNKELKAIRKAQTLDRYLSSVNALMENKGRWE